MEKIKVQDAVGMVLCHDITAMRTGFKGVAFKRGHMITEEDVPKLLDIGKQTIFIWEDKEGLVHEDDAALKLSKLANLTDLQNTHYSGPNEGKMLLFADEDGMLRVNKQLLDKINAIGDITIATLPDHYPVKRGARIASMRVVPLAINEDELIVAEYLSKDKKLIELKPYKFMKVGIIITGSEIFTGRIKDKFESVAREKLKKYPAEILDVCICDDDVGMIMSAAERLISMGADLLLFSGGMSVDPDDVTPAAIKCLNAEIVSYGVPSQPGNMTLVAYKDKVTFLGVPGAAISMPITIFDVLLPQIFSGEKITREDIKKLGNGGLCQLCETCHFPNCTFGRY